MEALDAALLLAAVHAGDRAFDDRQATGPGGQISWRSFTVPGRVGDDGTPQLQVEATQSGFVRYDALDVATPPRPAGEAVPDGATAAIITVCNGIPERQAAQVTLTDPTAIAALAATINRLPRMSAGRRNCAEDSGLRIPIDLEDPAAPAVQVMDFPACGSARLGAPGQWPALSDQGLETAVQVATGWDIRQIARSTAGAAALE